MDFKCSFENCESLPMSYCMCRNSYYFLCTMHFQLHLEEKPSINHSTKPLYISMNEDNKTEYIESFSLLMNLVESTIKIAKSSFETAIESLKSLQSTLENHLKRQISTLEFFIKEATTENKAINIPGYEGKLLNGPVFQFNILNLKEQIISLREKLSYNVHNIMEYLPVFLDDNEEILDFDTNANLDEQLYYFKIGTKCFVEFNVDELIEKTHQINVNENQGSLALTCQVPGNKLFYLGGYNPNLDTTYLIDLKTFNAEPLPKCRVLSLTCATYFNHRVYIFSGWGGSPLNACNKYDIIQKKWIILSNCPFAAQDTNALLFSTFFLLSGQNVNALWKYNIQNDRFLQLPYKFEIMYSMFFRDEKVSYFINKNELYISHDTQANIWAKHMKELSIHCIQHTSKPVKRGKNIYFASIYSHKVCRFNLTTLDLYLVTNI